MIQDTQQQVIILGAGLAGLTAAYRLKQAGVSIQVLESRNRIGGRIHTVPLDGGTVEMGATWFADKHQHLISLARELGVGYEPQYTGNKALYDYRNPDRIIQVMDIPSSEESTFIFSRGSQSLNQRLFENLEPGEVLLDHKVKEIIFEENTWRVRTEKGEFQGQFIINTLPPNLFINTIEMKPGLPSQLTDLSADTHTWMGESIKVGLGFPESFWRHQGIGLVFSQFGPIAELHDHIHKEQSAHVLKGFIDASYHPYQKKEREERVREQIKLYFPHLSSQDISYYEMDWQDEEATYHPYQEQVYAHQNNGHPVFRKSYFNDHFFFAGSETAENFPGYMVGAVERGETVAEQIIFMQLESNTIN